MFVYLVEIKYRISCPELSIIIAENRKKENGGEQLQSGGKIEFAKIFKGPS